MRIQIKRKINKKGRKKNILEFICDFKFAIQFHTIKAKRTKIRNEFETSQVGKDIARDKIE